jgi:WD40 repeat protein
MDNKNTLYNFTLANYFASKPLYLDEPTQKKPNTRKLVEQPWQQTKAAILEKDNEKLWDNITNTLCNLDFIQAKAAAKMTYELINDFNEVLELIPDNSENIRKEKERQARMDKYTQDLIACAKGEISTEELDIPESITPWTTEQIDAEIERIKTCPTRADRLNDFTSFLGQEAGNLQNYASVFANFSYQQAWNYSNDGPVGISAERISIKIFKFILVRTYQNRPVWNPKSQILKNLIGHTSHVTSIDITPNGKYCISASADNTCIFWNLKTGNKEQILNYNAVTKEINLINNFEQSVQSSSEDEANKPWNKKTITSVAITPDGEKAISGSSSGMCIFWNLKTGEIIHVLKGHESSIRSLAITADGTKVFSGSSDSKCILWNLRNGQKIQTFNGHSSAVETVAMTPDGKFAISGSEDKTCILWDLINFKKIRILHGHTETVYSISITPDGKYLLSGSLDGTLVLWNLNDGEQILTIKIHPLDSVAITTDGKYAVSRSISNSMILWNLKTGKEVQTLDTTGCFGGQVRITPDGLYAVINQNDNCILWNFMNNFKNQTIKRHKSFINSIAVSPNGSYAITSSLDKTCNLWDLKTGNLTATILKQESTIDSLAITPDNYLGIAGKSDGRCFIWYLRTGLWVHILTGHNSFVNSVTLTPDGKKLVSGSADRTCILWDIKTGQKIQTLLGHNHVINAIAISPDGQFALLGSNYGDCCLWNLKTFQKTQTLQGHTDDTRAVTISPDGHYAASGSSDNTCILWNIKTGRKITTFRGHTSSINALVFTPDGEYLISGSDDGTCILWDIETYNQLSIFVISHSIKVIRLSFCGILLGCSNGELIIINLNKNLLHPGKSKCSIVQIWDFEKNNPTYPLTDCPLCGHRFEPPQTIIQTIIQILNEAGITPDQSPCLELPDEAWEHHGLLGECPNCHEKLKFNPFFGSDMKGITDYYSSQERENKYQIILDEAENAFNNGDWENAYNQYLKLVQQGKFDINEMRFKMAICQINRLDKRNKDIINNINGLIKIFQDKGANDYAKIISDKLKVRIEVLLQEEYLKEKAEKPWWKKMF